MDNQVNILIAEDEPIIASKVSQLVEELQWSPTIVTNIPNLLEALSSAKPMFEIVVLDRMMDGSDSADFLTSIRMQYPTIKIFVLSAIDSSIEKAKLLDGGADDYLAKPFESVEFKARLKALMRRSALNPVNINYSLANISLDLIQRNISVNGKLLNLTAKEFLVLHALCSNVGKIFNKNQLIQSIWGFSLDNETNVVESTMNSLRRKLEHAGSKVQIKNTRYIGYWVEV